MLKTCAGHSAHDVAHSHQRQLVEGSRARLAPDETRERHLPVAERNDDVVIFQTLALVYAQQLYAVGIVGLYGQVAIAVVPLFKEPLYVGRVVYGKLVYDIEEGAHKRALTLYLVELVKTLQMLGKLKERKGRQVGIAKEQTVRNLACGGACYGEALAALSLVALAALFPSLDIFFIETGHVSLHDLVGRV